MLLLWMRGTQYAALGGGWCMTMACADHVVMLTHHARGSLKTVESMHEFPQSIEIRRVEGFRQVHKGSAGVGLHFLKFLLQLTVDEDHVGGYELSSEGTPAFWQKSLFQIAVETVEKDVIEKLPDDVEKRDSSAIVTELPVPLPFIEMKDYHILEVLRNLSVESHLL
ncbi:hypothetical protein SprV_0301034500 [Sparganum proliferum]